MKSIRTQSRAGNPIRRPPNSGGGESSSGYASSSGYSSASSSVAFEGRFTSNMFAWYSVVCTLIHLCSSPQTHYNIALLFNARRWQWWYFFPASPSLYYLIAKQWTSSNSTVTPRTSLFLASPFLTNTTLNISVSRCTLVNWDGWYDGSAQSIPTYYRQW